ncbi:MAG: metalloregulator ArsR/SmtB family transcription factor [Pseudomonadota bacterium]
MVQTDRAARIFKVLSVETRLRLINLLRHRSLCVNALARRLGVTPAAVSQHLRVLRDADVVIADKQGYHVHYRINSDTLAQWAGVARVVLEASDSTDDADAFSRVLVPYRSGE